MAPSFDDAYRAATERQAEAHRAEQAQKRLAEDSQSRARAIAEPALLSLAEPLRRRLEASRIPMHTSTDRASSGLFARNRVRRFWPLAPYFYGQGQSLKLAGFSSSSLVLTRSGHFSMDYGLSGPEGFAALLDNIDFKGSHSDALFVDPATNLLHYRRTEIVGETYVQELSAYLANMVLRLELVASNRRNGTA